MNFSSLLVLKSGEFLRFKIDNIYMVEYKSI